MVWGAMAAAAAPIVGGALGYEQGHGDRLRAKHAQEQALAAMQGLELPEYNTAMPDLPQYAGLTLPELQASDYSGVQEYVPEMLDTQNMGPSAMEGISTDPALRAAQMKALDKLSAVGEEGMTAEDKFRLAQMQQETSRAERGSREAIMQNMAQRGVGGSGMELAAQLSGQQSAAERGRMEALGIEGMAQQRALDAMSQSGQLSGQVRGQDFGEQSSVAQAQDAIARFNAQQAASTQSANVAAQNAAQQQAQSIQMQQAQEQANIANQQGMMGVDAQKYQNQLNQQGYGDQMGQLQYGNQLQSQSFGDAAQKASGLSGAYNQSAAQSNQLAQNKANMFAGIGQGVGQGLSAYGAKK